MDTYELCILRIEKISNEAELIRMVLENASLEECVNRKNEMKGTLSDDEFFLINSYDHVNCWIYSNDGLSVEDSLGIDLQLPDRNLIF